MTGRAMALIAAARKALAAVPGAASARVVRDRRREDVPLSQQTAYLIQPLGSQTLRWPESADWSYELTTFVLATIGRGRPGSAVQHRLAELHGAALEALRASSDILDLVCDGPPAAGHEFGDTIAAVRCGPAQVESDRPGDPLAVVTTVGLCASVSQPGTSATLDEAPLFASGPHEIVAGSAVRGSGERLFNGLRGAMIVDLGERPRMLVQRGRLSAAGAESLAQLEEAVEARVDGCLHALVDRGGNAYPHVRVERFTRRGPVEVGLRCHRPYEVEYTEFLREIG